MELSEVPDEVLNPEDGGETIEGSEFVRRRLDVRAADRDVVARCETSANRRQARTPELRAVHAGPGRRPN